MNTIDLLPVVLSFAGTLVLTPVVRALARRRGVVARPKSDRWHKKPTALLGGGAIFTNELSAGSVIAGLSVKLPDPAARVLELSLERQRALFYSVADQLKQAQLVSDFGSITARVLDPPVATENRPSIALVLLAAPAQCDTVLSSSPHRLLSVAEGV